jgi:non-specific serine/threonine protein kinase/serine/threonine-protein kinase
MQPERWRHLEQLYHAAMGQPADQRSAFLESSCAGDLTLRDEVASLIAYSQQDGRIIDQSAVEVVAAAMAEDLRAEDRIQTDKMIGARIAQYRLIEKLGAGGMGDVYRAVRADDQYEKQVAIKLVRQGLATEFVYARFRKERQILAGFEHENIARLLDGGTTDQGYPYFVMELVEGRPIDEYCDERKLGVAARLDLFQSVCSAVQYAHQRLVVHRDIKPSNILVTVDGMPKLLDFGIATILSPETYSPEADPTVTALRMMTPQFASPEQLRGEVITTASDVYSMGVVLYKLLTGRLPYRLDTNSPYDLTHAICEVEPDKPSTAVGRSAPVMEPGGKSVQLTPEWISNCRSSSPEKLRRTLAGDLDQILLKALRKEPQRRYASAQDFADDLQSYVLGLPVSARRGTFSYRSGKFIRRHKLPLAAAAVFALVVIAGGVAIVREARIARMQRARAEQRFESLRKLTNSMLFEFHDSIETLPGSTAARELVVRRALEYLDQIAAEEHNDPATLRDLAAAYERIGQIQSQAFHPHTGGAGSLQQSNQLFEKALEIRRKLASSNPEDLSLQFELLGSMLNVAVAYEERGDLDRALALQQQRLEIEERLAAKHDSEELRSAIGSSLIGIGDLNIWLGNNEAAVEYMQRALAMSQASLDASPKSFQARRSALRAHSWLGTALKFDRKYSEAASETRKALALAEQLAAGDPHNTYVQRYIGSDTEELCKCLAYAGLFSEVQSNCRRAIAIDEDMMKSDKDDVQATADFASTNLTMGLALYLMHSPREALVFLRRADSTYQDVAIRDPDSQSNAVDHATALIYSGRTEADLHQPEQARRDFERAQKMLEQLVTVSPKHRYFLNTLEEARAAIKALPYDTAPIAIH